MQEQSASWPEALAAGAVGALALTAIHQGAKRVLAHPPRMDSLGRRAVVRSATAVGLTAPKGQPLHRLALVGALVSDGLYYTMVARGRGRNRWGRAMVMGTAAGLGGVYLPPYIGLGKTPDVEHRSTRLLTTAWYVAGALVAAAVAGAMTSRRAAVGGGT